MQDETIFYVVWNPNGGSPRVRHQCEESAKQEALRLAEQNPGQEFIVLASVGTARKVTAEFRSHCHPLAPF